MSEAFAGAALTEAKMWAQSILSIRTATMTMKTTLVKIPWRKSVIMTAICPPEKTK